MANIDHKMDANFDIMEELELTLAEKAEIIKELEKKLALLMNRKPEPVRPANQFYIPVKGDEIDEKLAAYINICGTPVPWKR